MRKSFGRQCGQCAGGLILALAAGIGGGFGAIGIPGEAAAAESASARPERRRRIPNINEATWRRLAEVQEHIDVDEWPQAKQVLEGMLERSRRYNGNELGQIHNLLAHVSYELGDVQATIRHYEQVVAQMPDISEAMENTTLSQLSRLYYGEGNKVEGEAAMVWYRKALETIMVWLGKNENPGPDAHFYIAQIYYQMQDFPNAIARLEQLVALALERGIAVKESWWTMLQFLHLEEENWPRVIEILEVLVRDYPKRAYWMNLASVYGEVDELDKQLWTLEAAHVGGYLDQEADWRTYGSVLLQNDIPNRASKFLQVGIDSEMIQPTTSNLQVLGTAYQLSQDVDKAIPVFEQAARSADDGRTYNMLSGLYLQRDRFTECVDAAERALDKGGLVNDIDTKITLGTCQFNLDKLEDARATFVSVRQDARRQGERTEERNAAQWVTYIDSETRRREALER